MVKRFLLAWLLAAGAAGAADLQIQVTARDGKAILLERSVHLRAGEEVRLEKKAVRVPGYEASLDILVGVALRAEDGDSATFSLNGIVRSAGKDHYRLSSLVVGIVNSDAFRHQGVDAAK